MARLSIIIFLISMQFFSAGQSCNPDALIHRIIAARTTDDAFGIEIHKSQIYINSDCVPNNKLLLHLVGSFDNPANTTYYPTLAANAGFKVINLKYANNVSVKGACSESIDINCFRDYRQEIIFGTPVSSQVEVDSTESIINRLSKLLIYLHALYPSEGWDDYLLDSQDIDWSEILVSGHSQGGGHAAFIAKRYEVSRVLMFASPNDFSAEFNAPAGWLNDSSITATSKFYAFGNTLDEAVDYEEQLQNWEALKLLELRDSVKVDNLECGYDNAQVLYTEYDGSGLISPNHNAVIIDNYTPVSSDLPVYSPVWEYMLGECGLMSSNQGLTSLDYDIKVYPNPTNSAFQIQSEENIAQVRIYNSVGKLIQTAKPNDRNFRIELSSNPGIFYVHLRTLSGINKTVKVFKTK